jgi:hypothetical protein
MEAHVWALRADDKNDLDRSKDYAAAEALANHLVAAVHTVAFGSYQAVSEDWTTAAGSAQRLGAVCVVGFDVYFPWVRETDTLGLVTAMPIVVGTEHG